MISLWVVNSINHPEFKRTFVTSFLHPFFNSITFIPTCIATFLNLFLINLCCPSPTSRSIIFNLPPSPPPLSLLSFLSSLPRFHLRLFLIRLFFGRRHKGRVISGEIRLWGRLLPIRNQANYHPCLDFKNLKHAHNLTQTEVDFKIEVMLKKIENISTTSLSLLYQLRATYSKTVHPHQFNYCCQMANGKCSKIYVCNLIVVVFTRGVQHFIQIFCYNRFVHMFKICKRIQPGQNSVSCMRKITHSWSLLLYISNPLFITVYRFFVETQVLCVYKMLFMYHARTDYTCTATLWHFYTSLGQYRILMHIYTSLVQYRISMRL